MASADAISDASCRSFLIERRDSEFGLSGGIDQLPTCAELTRLHPGKRLAHLTIFRHPLPLVHFHISPAELFDA
jgi:hypothetical protein